MRDSLTFVVAVPPMGKPRMTQRDAWKKRPVVLRYHAFKDALRLAMRDHREALRMIESGEVVSLSWTAWFAMPASWSKKQRAQMAGTYHRARPDRDNVDKALLDALFKEDSGIAAGELVKRWDDGNGPRLKISMHLNLKS